VVYRTSILLNIVNYYTVRHKKTLFFHHNLKKSEPVLISFSTNIPGTINHQKTV